MLNEKNELNQKNELKQKLKEKLKEIFQFEKEDLDFGIYKIMNYKRKEIENFIEKELIEEISKQLKLKQKEEINKIEKEIEEVKKEIKENIGDFVFINGELKEEFKNTRLGMKYYEKKNQLEKAIISEDLEKDIYNHLINFFSRYYDKGDFISKRRYGKNEKYVIPYNGEEVLLYWVNKDQYYIKTTEYFRKYTFKVKSDSLTVNFRVVDAQEDKGNIKALERKFFVLNENIFDFDKNKKELNIYFEYRGLTKEEEEKYKYNQSVSQDKINEEIIRILQERIPESSLARLIFEIEGEKTLIEKHLNRYTKRNTTDYFIHKDLKGFLQRELDFYIKNEFLKLEDLQVLEKVLTQGEYFERLRIYFIGISTFRNIALKIIDFLAQIENFQKKLWEKKKFIIDTHYVITLDKIKEYAGERFLEGILDEILGNEKQLKEWEELFGVKVEGREDLIEKNILLFKGWKKLPIDTKYFNEDFKWKLLVALSEKNSLDEILDGVLIKSENFQALNLLLNKYYEKVQTIYIDPPYNTGSDDFLYKDNYQHSSWLTMMENRLALAKELMKDDGIFFTSIGEKDSQNRELSRYICILDEIFGNINWIQTFSVETANQSETVFVIRNKEFIISYAKNIDKAKFNLSSKIQEARCTTSNPNQTMPVIEFPPNLRVEGLEDGVYTQEDFWIEGSNENLEFIEPKTMEVRNGKLSHSIKIKARWSNSNDLRNFFLNQRSSTKFGKEIIEVYFQKFKKGKSLKVIMKKKGFDKPTSVLRFTQIGSTDLLNLFFKNLKEYIEKLHPKSIELIEFAVNKSFSDSIILDFFAGSGTTAHAVMKVNKEDNGKRKFILIEIADYFYTVIIPRIKKVAYSFNWKEGKPQDIDGIGVFFKYHTLEQYEDALENIEFEKQNGENIEYKKQNELLYELPDYFTKYILEWETKNSNTFLNLHKMKDPFNYKLKIIENYKQKIVNVDLIETFNYLIGLNVNKYKVLEDNERKYVFVFAEKQNKKIIIVWRNLKNIDFEKDKKIIENNIQEFNPDETYINGDAIVKNFTPIEPLFKSLMFEDIKQ